MKNGFCGKVILVTDFALHIEKNIVLDNKRMKRLTHHIESWLDSLWGVIVYGNGGPHLPEIDENSLEVIAHQLSDRLQQSVAACTIRNATQMKNRCQELDYGEVLLIHHDLASVLPGCTFLFETVSGLNETRYELVELPILNQPLSRKRTVTVGHN